MFGTRLTSRCCLGIALLCCACAGTGAPGFEQPEATMRMPVRVMNDSPEIVHVWLISDSGRKVWVGTVTPYSSAFLSPVISRDMTGRFYARRLSNDRVTLVSGEGVDGFLIGNRTVLIRIGAESAFDVVQLR